MNEQPPRKEPTESKTPLAEGARLGPAWLALEPRRGILFLTNIGLPILIGVLLGETSAALIGGITGLLLSLADTEGPLGGRLRLTLMVAAGIAAGGALGTWLNLVRTIFWVAFLLQSLPPGSSTSWAKDRISR